MTRIRALTRRGLIGAALTAPVVLLRRGAGAQDATPTVTTIGTPEAARIMPTGLGDFPSTGGARPGPVGGSLVAAPTLTVQPIGLVIADAGVDADIEQLQVQNGQMPDPTGPWIVAWYTNLGQLAAPDNVVMAGHVDFWNVGPSVFYNLATLQPGSRIDVLADTGEDFPYTVDWVKLYDAENAPLDELTASTGSPVLTLFTCGGTFDFVNGHYLQRTVVRASLARA